MGRKRREKGREERELKRERGRLGVMGLRVRVRTRAEDSGSLKGYADGNGQRVWLTAILKFAQFLALLAWPSSTAKEGISAWMDSLSVERL